MKGIVGKLALGEADAGFVYATDVRAASSRLLAIPLPAVAADRPLRGRGREGSKNRAAALEPSPTCSHRRRREPAMPASTP